MFATDQYQLLDFGEGRKLERFGVEVLDRPSPAAVGHSISDPDLWGSATARFDVERGGKGQWDDSTLASDTEGGFWPVRHGESHLLLKLSASGNVGLFPEHASTWGWIASQIRSGIDARPADPPRVLNLFAYTGGASLAAAIAGAHVTHVDSSGPTVAWAKRNAEASKVADLPVRWLVEDAMKFVTREVRRGNHYDGIIADPPTYGHGPKGKPFKFGQHLDELIELCGQLVNRERSPGQFLLFSCHAPGFETADAVSTVASVLPDSEAGRVTGQPLTLECGDGRILEAGISAQWSSPGPQTTQGKLHE